MIHLLTRHLLVAALLSMSALVACSSPPPPPPPPVIEEPPPPFQHVVRYSGETLGLIARWYTGKTQNWTFLRDANPGLSPNRINIGDVVVIPNELLTRTEVMPKSAVGRVVTSSASGSKPDVEESDRGAAENATGEVESSSGASVDSAPVSPPVETPAGSAVDELDQLEKELESALAERGKGAGTTDAGSGAAGSAPPSAGATGDEAEREKLLDELLAE